MPDNRRFIFSEKLIENSKLKESGKKKIVSEKVNIDDEDEDDDGYASDFEGSADQPLDF